MTSIFTTIAFVYRQSGDREVEREVERQRGREVERGRETERETDRERERAVKHKKLVAKAENGKSCKQHQQPTNQPTPCQGSRSCIDKAHMHMRCVRATPLLRRVFEHRNRLCSCPFIFDLHLRLLRCFAVLLCLSGVMAVRTRASGKTTSSTARGRLRSKMVRHVCVCVCASLSR